MIPFVTFILIIGTAALIIAYGRGYRLDINKKLLKTTGLLVVKSDPSGASILIDGTVKSATDATINLPPGWYALSLVKDGFQPWEKRVRVQGEVVSTIEAVLLSANPSLTAITTSGAASPVLSPDGGKLAFVVPATPEASNGAGLISRAGVYILDLIDKPLGLNRDAKLIGKSNGIDFSQATLSWSPDSKQILAEVPVRPIQNPLWFLMDADKPNEASRQLFDIRTLKKEWGELRLTREKEKLATLPSELVEVATTSMRLMDFSPDETKILYEATASATIPKIIKPPLIGTNPTTETRNIAPGSLYVYDVKEDRNYPVGLRTLPALRWLPASRHLLAVERDRIEILDYDGGNRKTAYAGPFWDSFAVPWASAGKIVILTTLNPKANGVNNLYVINLR